IFEPRSLQATADPKDKTYARQKQSAAIAEKVFAAQPDHPGAAHYIIHAYDYPALAQKGLPAAGRYAQFAPAVPHALHMPSHIYVLLGMWPETVQGNVVAAEAERQRGNPDDHMHAIDFARATGAARPGQAARAKSDVDRLAELREALLQAKDGYWAEQVEIQRRGAMAWLARAEGRNDEALATMRAAAELEDATE